MSRRQSNILKAIAMAAVLISHISGYYKVLKPLNICIYWYCILGMSLFMFISGYGVFKSYETKGFDTYWDDKLARILIPMFIVNLFSTVSTYFFSHWGGYFGTYKTSDMGRDVSYRTV